MAVLVFPAFANMADVVASRFMATAAFARVDARLL
jgi:hypothetical protein